ncbi:hypothetical protein GLOTRDRAFT_10815, partial [Gloeophyllum trabeum ATCC 11539]
MGVKSLWDLLTPVGRPVLLETIEGKSMAIDSSIWIYQFQATMRDKEGRALVNAHVLGFLRRICKLLFYGIKPVFVFDGGAPAMKRNTLADRKRKKHGAAESHARVAEKLLAAQLRRKAVEQAQDKGKGKAPARVTNGDMVYLEDIDGSPPRTPVKANTKPVSNGPSPSSSKKKSRFQDHDPYKLPDVNMDEVLSQAARSTVPDPRLATEDELRAFIEEMRPEDFDVTSPEFRELPTEVQYEIIGDLRLRSRQTSYDRLQNMLRNSRTPLDFSKEQIKNLKQRNALTQQLLVTTDSIGQAHIAIPVRIASERNKEYVLVKNEGESGGWVLGIRDEGTQDKPIQIDQDTKLPDDDEDSDQEMEEVNVDPAPLMDADLREFRRGMALSAIAKRQSPKKANATAPPTSRPKKPALFAPEEPEDTEASMEDPELAVAMQESLDYAESAELERALHASRDEQYQRKSSGSAPTAGTSGASLSVGEQQGSPPLFRRSEPSSPKKHGASTWNADDLYASPSRLETALSIGNVRPSRTSFSQAIRTDALETSSMFGSPSLLVPTQSTPSARNALDIPSHIVEQNRRADGYIEETGDKSQFIPAGHTTPLSPPNNLAELVSESEEDMEAVIVPEAQEATSTLNIAGPAISAHTDEHPLGDHGQTTFIHLDADSTSMAFSGSADASTADRPPGSDNEPVIVASNDDAVTWAVPSSAVTAQPPDDTSLTELPRSPSPVDEEQAQSAEAEETRAAEDTWDAAQEMDPTAEEGEFARFISQVKGRDLNDVRNEIDAEIKALNEQRKIALRDSEDITHQMVAQIMTMLRLFGIPYITAPMEAEAQCAELVRLELVDGVITDDSDVFLFGGLRVYKNMFNQSKTVECFLLSDLARELGLDRDKLIRLAYLLGSDYVEGLPRVGPVVAMELLTEFPGEDGLHKFKEWWTKVQSGKDTEADNKSSFRKRFKKRFKDLYLPPDWPNPAVRDAYYHPTVDSSEEPFKWGLPDLDALRGFLHEELGWGQIKVDDLLLPIIQRVGKRGQTAALNRQGNLNTFLDVTAGSGTYAPRKRQAYTSKRLQEVVTNFRKQRSKSGDAASASASPAPQEGAEEESRQPAAKKRKTGAKKNGEAVQSTAKRGAAKEAKASKRGRGRAASSKRRARKSDTEDDEGSDFAGRSQAPSGDGDESAEPLRVQLRPRPKP